MANRSKIIAIFMFLILFAAAGITQSTDNVRLFQSYLLDTPIDKAKSVQPDMTYSSFDEGSVLTLGANGGYPVNPKLEILGSINYISSKPDEGDGASGLADPVVVARYQLSNKTATQFAAGGLITLPVGADTVGQGNLNFGGYAAVRHALKNKMVITGNAALMFEEVGDDRESSMEISAGLIYPKDKSLNFVGELVIKSDKDYMLASCGVDYLLNSGRFRGGVGLGLDDLAPDFVIYAGYLLTL